MEDSARWQSGKEYNLEAVDDILDGIRNSKYVYFKEVMMNMTSQKMG